MFDLRGCKGFDGDWKRWLHAGVGWLRNKAQHIQTPTLTFVTHWPLNCGHVFCFIAHVGQ